jgi:hypothetical protein
LTKLPFSSVSMALPFTSIAMSCSSCLDLPVLAADED